MKENHLSLWPLKKPKTMADQRKRIVKWSLKCTSLGQLIRLSGLQLLLLRKGERAANSFPKWYYAVYRRHSFFTTVTWHHHVATLSLLKKQFTRKNAHNEFIRICKLFQSILGDGTYLKYRFTKFWTHCLPAVLFFPKFNHGFPHDLCIRRFEATKVKGIFSAWSQCKLYQ